MNGDETAGRLEACRETLEAIAADRTLLDALPETSRRALLEAAGRVTHPIKAELRAAAKKRHRAKKREKRARDEAILSSTGIRKGRTATMYETPPALPPTLPESVEAPQLGEERKCYICKTRFRETHRFYDSMCVPCGELNYERRFQSADLSGRVAIVTGARVKIGYQAAIKLLRAGAEVIVTTRFAHDAAARYAREEDFEDWQGRLSIYGLDLRHTPSVERFCAHVRETRDRLH